MSRFAAQSKARNRRKYRDRRREWRRGAKHRKREFARDRKRVKYKYRRCPPCPKCPKKRRRYTKRKRAW